MESQEIEWLLKEKYNGVKSDAFYADCKSLALGEPLAYLIGHAPFLSCKIWLDHHPLIPRPETEFWVEEAIRIIKGGETLALGLTESKPPRVLDLCAGSGCIGVAVANAIKDAEVEFGEIDTTLIPTIKKNIQENLFDPDSYPVHHTNLFSNLSGRYDFILTNPPYIDQSLGRTDESVRTHEPHLALFGGIAGLELIQQIIERAGEHLAVGGQLWIEHEPEQVKAIHTLGTQNGFTSSTHTDQYNVSRYSILVLQ